MRLDHDQLHADFDRRARWNPGEHPALGKLVALRVVMNQHFGDEFRGFDHELAQIETELAEALGQPSQSPVIT